jgi:glycosyltransferase involved in cell wall biosynthesis/GR25 family glycosyltransferase involved in LPS biosynthesis
MADLREARELYRRNRLHEALRAYEELKKKNHTIAYDGNISLIQRKLEQARPLISVGEAISEIGIESVYVVNLKRRPDRKIKVLREFLRHGIIARFIGAEDALTSQEAMNLYRQYKKRPVGTCEYSQHISIEKQKKIKSTITIGAFAYLLSQKKVIQDAASSGFNRICVFDDDVFFTDSAATQLTSLKCRFSASRWNIMLFGASEYSYPYVPDFEISVRGQACYTPIPGRTCGSFGVAYDSSIFDELIKVIEAADGTYDNNVLGWFYATKANSCYVITPNICTPSVTDSDIREGARDQIVQSQRMHWDTDNYFRWKESLQISIIVSNRENLRYVPEFRTLGDLSLRLYYVSRQDGLRPIISGQVLPKHSLITETIKTTFESLTAEEQKKELTELGLPFSDLTIIWPSHKYLTEDTIRELVIASITSNRIDADQRIFMAFGRKVIPGLTSIIIPSFRPPKQIWPTVLSALSQQGAETEVIVVNDNPDNEDFEEELHRCMKKEDAFPKSNQLVIASHAVNRNASAARNTGIYLSKGEYISFLDDDDLYGPHRICNGLLRLASESVYVGAAYCGFTGAWHGDKDSSRFKDGNFLKEILCLNYSSHYIHTDTVIFRKDALLRLGGFNESYNRHQDIELFARYFKEKEMVSTKTYDVLLRPVKVNATFSPTVTNLLSLKVKFFSDFRYVIQQLDEKQIDECLSNHTEDICKRSVGQSDSQREFVRSLLEQLIRN